MDNQLKDDLELEMQDLLRKFREAEREAQPYLDIMVNVREQLKNMAIATGIAPAISDMYVEIVGSYSRVSWNTNSLMALAQQEPKILACRKDTQVKPTIRIKHGERTDE